MKTNEQILNFYGLEIGKTYKITKACPRSFRNAIGELFSVAKGEKNLLIYLAKDDSFRPIYELNFFDYEEYKEELLNAKEKEYLNSVIKPFKKRVKYLKKTTTTWKGKKSYFISIFIDNDGKEDFLAFPEFYAETNMYKNLVSGIQYTLEQLGLDE